VFPARFFQGPVKHLVFQIFGAQPALAVGQRVTSNIVEGRPASEGIGEAYGQGVVGGLVPALGHKVVSRFLPTRAPSRSKGNQPPAQPIIPSFKDGTFSISDWTNYPDFLRKPDGPFRLLEGEEYEAARSAADRANQRIHRAEPAAHKNMQVHEIHPVKFGGSPTDRANKIVLPAGTHRLANRWWDRLRWNLLRDKAKRS
jgi:hypothetical protein